MAEAGWGASVPCSARESKPVVAPTPAFLLGGTKAPEASSAGHAHPEDVPGLALPDALPADAQKSDPHLRLVPGQQGAASLSKRRGGLWFRVWPLLTVLMFPQQRKHYGKIKASTLLIQAFVRGWKVTKGRGGGRLLGYAPGCDTEPPSCPGPAGCGCVSGRLAWACFRLDLLVTSNGFSCYSLSLAFVSLDISDCTLVESK